MSIERWSERVDMKPINEVAWLRYRAGQGTIVLVGLLYAALAWQLRSLPTFDDLGPVTGRHALLAAAAMCILTAVWPDRLPLRALSGAAVVGAAGWRAAASALSLGAGPALVWTLVVVLLLSTWTYLLPPAVQPPNA